jgi:hypothetical protein
MTGADQSPVVGHAQRIAWVKTQITQARRALKRAIDIQDLALADQRVAELAAAESVLAVLKAATARHASDPAAGRLRTAAAFLERIRDRPTEAQDLAEEAIARLVPQPPLEKAA